MPDSKYILDNRELEASSFSEEIKAGLSPQMLELIQAAPYNHTKEIVKDEVRWV